MVTNSYTKPVRRVVSGWDASGVPEIAEDSVLPIGLDRPGVITATELWRFDRLPASLQMEIPRTPVPLPPINHGGFAARIVTIPPNVQLDSEEYAAYEMALLESYGPERTGGPNIPGIHRSGTVDILTVIDGEVVIILAEGVEVTLRVGETFVQRGTPHSWRNRTDSAANVLAVIVPTEETRAHPD
jgi:mannose-6-phosphate isomerase-like protein (cupin superfamily)